MKMPDPLPHAPAVSGFGGRPLRPGVYCAHIVRSRGRTMADADTNYLSGVIDRLGAGDPAARDELIRSAMGRLEQLARKMLRGFPGVKRWEDTGDVLQNALLRLVRALGAVTPGSSREFFGLAAAQIRRELLDLARHYQGALGLGRNHQSGLQRPDGASPEFADAPAETGELDRWAALHEAVETLPVVEREVFCLTFYHGWTQPQIGELLQIDERTVRRRWQSAAALLQGALGNFPPG